MPDFVYLTYIGAEICLLNSTGIADEGQEISICTELMSINGGLSRPLSVSTNTLSGTAECKKLLSYNLHIKTGYIKVAEQIFS